MQARNLNSISHVTQCLGVQYVRKTLNSTLLMIKSEALAVLPSRPAVPLARNLGCTRVIPSVDVLVIAEDCGGQARHSVVLRHDGDFPHSGCVTFRVIRMSLRHLSM